MTPAGSDKRPALSLRAAEIGVALFLFALGGLLIFDSLRLGIRWQEVHGPEPGYFPFYLGVFVCAACVVTVVLALRMPEERNRAFVQVGQLKLVLAVLIPSSVFVALVGWIGIYVSALIFVAFFMRWLGKYPWWKVAAVSVGNSVFFFLIFEVWFKIPLPKGPLEALLRLN
jgi:hypothetical protein